MVKYLVVFVTALAIVSGCTTSTGTAPPQTASTISVTAPGSDVRTNDRGPAAQPAPALHFLSDLFDIGPSGPLRAPAAVTIRLSKPVPNDDVVVIATRENSNEPWDYLPATIAADRTTVRFTTSHFSIFGVLAYSLTDLVDTFKRDFVDGIDGGATQTIDKPVCDNEQDARRNNYSIASDTTDTVFWCFGESTPGTRILKVTDHRRYPLIVAHPNMRVISNTYDRGELSALSRLASGQNTIIAPGDTTVFNADLPEGGTEGIQTQLDGLGQSLDALWVGATTLLEILDRFGARSDITAVKELNTLLTVRSCVDSVGKGSGAIIAGCFSPNDILEAFGTKGLLLAPIMATGPVIAFFHSEWNALVDQFNGHSVYRIAITRAQATPTLDITPFVGDWYEHAGDLNVHSDGSISLTYQSSATVDGLLTSAFPQLTLHIVSTSPGTAIAVVQTSDDPATRVGAKVTLRRTTIGVTITPLAGGTSAWCDPPHRTAGDCGA